MIAIVNAAVFFAAVRLGLDSRMKILASHALNTAKRIFGVPDFLYYALADGIRDLLSTIDEPFKAILSLNNENNPQLELPLLNDP